MAYKGKRITNPVNGQTIEFITTAKDSDGEVLEMVSCWRPRSQKPAAHYHPLQTETFKVLDGTLTVMVRGKIIRLTKGEKLEIPAKTVHAMWNDSDAPVTASWKIVPAGKTEFFLETAMGLASDGKVSKEGVPDVLQSVLLARKYYREFRLAKPSYFLQTIIFYLLTPIARLAGKKAEYSRYTD